MIATLFRFYIANSIGVWYPSYETWDDQLMIYYADLQNFFLHPNPFSLVKTMSFPLFLNFVHITGLSFPMVLTLMWIAASILMVVLLSYFMKNKYFLAFSYLFVLYTPAAFDNWIGTRFYRNVIIAPSLFLVFELSLIMVYATIKGSLTKRKLLVLSLGLGFLFTFSYYIKEDGLWLFPSLILSILTCLSITLYRFWKCKREDRTIRNLAIKLFMFCIPILFWVAGANIYKMVNYRFFGVYETNTRTEGELGKFVNLIYRIESKNRTPSIWAPADAIEKAFAASETLMQHPQLEENILENSWYGNAFQVPLKGDHLSWVIRSSLYESGMFESERYVNDLFREVNREIETAFSEGTLHRDHKIQLLSSVGGRTVPEIQRLYIIVKDSFRSHIMTEYYAPGAALSNVEEFNSSEMAEYFSNTNIVPFQGRAGELRNSKIDPDNQWIRREFQIYRIVNPFLVILGILGLIVTIVRYLLRKKFSPTEKFGMPLFTVLICIALAGIAGFYSLAVAWFGEFVIMDDVAGMDNVVSASISYGTIIKFYSVGIVPLLVIFALLGCCLLITQCGNMIMEKRSTKS